MAHILTVNPGSTAVKYTVYSLRGEEVEQNEFSRKEDSEVRTAERLWLRGLHDIEKISIRIVHGVEQREPCIIDEHVLDAIERGKRFAPLHNTIALDVIGHLLEEFYGTEIVAVFDTAFHAHLPEYARTYPIPQAITEDLQLYRYGFHGLALASIIEQLPGIAAEKSMPLPQKVIVAHLGGGSSITAIEKGVSRDTTMGVTPLEGVMMVTRSGSLGPDIPRLIGEGKFLSPQDVSTMLNEQSGFYGITGSKDTLDIITRAEQGEEPYALAVDMFVHSIVKHVFALYGVLQGCDALVFSGGIGFGNAYLRKRVFDKVSLMGITEDKTLVVRVDEARVLFHTARRVTAR